MQKHSNEYYLNGIKNRDNDVLKQVFREFLPGITAFILKNSGQEEDARDIFNKVLYQFTARLDRDTIVINSKFEAYILTACKNLWRRELIKSEKRRVTNEEVKELYYEEKDLTQSTLEQERWELFKEKLAMLSDNCRQILEMIFKQLSSKEIMEQLGYSSEVTVRQRVFKCRSKLSDIIKRDHRYGALKN